MPLAWALLRPPGHYDKVLTSSHACAKAFPPGRTAEHFCYVHAPMRYAWDRTIDARGGGSLRVRTLAALREWDHRSAATVDHFAANSTAVQERIHRFYGRDARVICPPVDTEFFTPGDADRPRQGALAVSRFIPYKRIDLAIEACALAGMPLTIVGAGPQEADLRAMAHRANAPVEFELSPSDVRLRELYRSTEALVFPANEDFGIVAVEAQACGAPVVAVDQGGARDTVVAGVTGLLAARQDARLLADALRAIGDSGIRQADCRRNAERFSTDRFEAELRIWLSRGRFNVPVLPRLPTPGATRLSACIIARDEQAHLPGCLESVAFCDEIVVVDSDSRDGTRDVARAANARVVERPWLGYGTQRNVAIDHATGEWILEVDADERISPKLRAEIEAFIADAPPGVDLAALPLRDVFLGRGLGPSAKYPKYRHRLFRRTSYRHDEARTVHEGLVPTGEVHAFTGDLVHLGPTSWREAIADTCRYARLEASQLDAPRTPRAILVGALLRPSAKLGFRLAIDSGWRDGWAGAAKIALDCLGDSVVWTRHALGRTGAVRGRSGVAAGMHFGAWRKRLGDARLALLARGARDAEHAARWGAAARDAGADVVLVSDAPVRDNGLHLRTLPRFGPLLATRALDAEEQLRPLDAVVTFGRPARMMVRALALALAPRDALRLDGDALDPTAARAAALANRRTQPAT